MNKKFFLEFWEYYIHINKDLINAGIDTPYKAKKHWQKYGKNENRKRLPNESTINKRLFKVRPSKHLFREKQYLLNNPDLKNEKNLYEHYVNIGRMQGRNYVDTNINKTKLNLKNNNEKFLKYQYLFHKYKLDLISNNDLNKEIEYKVIKEFVHIKHKYFCHIHCYDISKFKTYFEKYYNIINSVFNIVITFHKGDIEQYTKNLNVCILQVSNKGIDIGAKFCFTKWINDSNINFEYILFLHSKTCNEAREKYINFFCKNKNRVKKIKSILDKEGLDFIFPDMRRKGDHMKRELFMNKVYTVDLINYYGGNYKTHLFFEGNVLIMSKKMVNLIFLDKYIYNVLNEEKSFDYNWVNMRYNLYKDIETTYKIYLKNKLIGNNLELRNYNDNWSDCMIEHAFERIYYNICISKNLKFIVLK